MTVNKLVEQNLDIVKNILTYHIHSNPTVLGMEYDDLYQEGCICLLRAALTYDEHQFRFRTYAQKVVYNGLVDYCRRVSKNQAYSSRLILTEDGTLLGTSVNAISDDFETKVSTLEFLDMMEATSRRYRGITKLGIEALTLRIQGTGVTEIASSYRVPPSHAGAWISRAIQKLRKDPVFLGSLR